MSIINLNVTDLKKAKCLDFKYKYLKRFTIFQDLLYDKVEWLKTYIQNISKWK